MFPFSSVPVPVPHAPRPTVVLPARPGFTIRDARIGDLADTARLHVRVLPTGLFPRLGARFVRRWHQAFLDSPDAVALTAVHLDPHGREHLVGFLMGATDRRAFHRELLTRHRTALLRRGVLALAVRPRTAARFLRTRLRPYLLGLRRSGTRHRADTNDRSTGDREIVADLTAVAVAPSWRRTGAGRDLVRQFLDRSAAAGTPNAELVAAIEPAGAAAFYVRTGWTARQQHVTRDGLRVQAFGRETGRAEND